MYLSYHKFNRSSQIICMTQIILVNDPHEGVGIHQSRVRIRPLKNNLIHC